MELPARLQEIASDDGNVLTVKHGRQTWGLDLLNWVVSATVVSMAVIAALTFGLGMIFLIVWFPILGLAWASAAWLSRRPHWVRFSSEGIAMSGRRVTHLPTPQSLIVRGDPGGLCEVSADGTRLFVVEMKERSPWNPDVLTAIAKAAASRMGVPLDDQRPSAAWARWRSDPVYRAACRWDERSRENQRSFPEHTTASPARSTTTVQDHHGMTVTLREGGPLLVLPLAVTITMDSLIQGDHEIPLADIVRVGPLFGANPRRYASFQVLTPTSWVELFCIPVEGPKGSTTRILHWLTAEIEAGAKRAKGRKQDAGNAAEVPSALRALRAKEGPH